MSPVMKNALAIECMREELSRRYRFFPIRQKIARQEFDNLLEGSRALFLEKDTQMRELILHLCAFFGITLACDLQER